MDSPPAPKPQAPSPAAPHARPAPPSTGLRRGLLLGLSAGLAACAAGARMPGMAQKADMAPAAAAPMPMGGAPMPPPPPPAPLEVAADEKAGDQPRKKAEVAGAEAGGWALVRQFPVPDYSQPYEGPRTDFRETVFWKPDLRTGEGGEAEVSFYLSDAVTSFRATAEGLSSAGQPGRGEAVVASKLPVSIAAKLPLEVTTGDTLELPVTVSNATSRSKLADVAAAFGAAFAPESRELQSKMTLAPGETRSLYYRVKVVGAGQAASEGDINLSAQAGSTGDALRRSLKVVPQGYTRHLARSGTLSGAEKITFDLPEPVAGSLSAKLSVFPSPAATLVAGTEAIVREPTGCFEQASSANYPNVMVLRYLAEQKAGDPALVDKTQGMLDRGYKRLVGYETKSRGFEWFGGDPGHEALTAYGLMQFADMAKVYPGLDKTLVSRTAEWLKSKRDGKGGYARNSRALDSFGRASPEVTNAYVTYALTETGEKDLAPEIDAARKLASQTKDPYLLALAAGTLANAGASEAAPALARLASLQASDGSFPGARDSITQSGGQSLVVETTSLAALSLMKTPEHNGQVKKALDWLTKQRSGGAFGSTQATVLALKALTRAAEASKGEAAGSIDVIVNGEKKTLVVDPKSDGEASLSGLAGSLKKGQNTIEIAPQQGARAPWSLSIDYRSTQPDSSPKSPVALTVSGPSGARMGEAVKVKAVIENKQGSALPMVIARIGIPGGLTYQTRQLDELRDKKLVDFYETREREVIVYFRGMGPKQKREIELDLLAQVPGRFTAPPSQAYLYYTDEHRTVAKPLELAVAR